MNKTAMHAQISAIINRGTSFDGFIPGACRRAVAMLENNNNFHYMHRVKPYSKNPTGSTVEQSPIIEVGIGILKRMDVLRYGLPGEQGSIAYTELEQTEFANIAALPANQLPTFFYPTFNVGPSGGAEQELLILGTAAFPQAVTFEVEGYWNTDYDALDAAAAHWLLTKGETVVMASAMIELLPIIRQPEAMPLWTGLQASGLKAVLLADDELIAGGRLEAIQPGD